MIQHWLDISGEFAKISQRVQRQGYLGMHTGLKNCGKRFHLALDRGGPTLLKASSWAIRAPHWCIRCHFWVSRRPGVHQGQRGPDHGMPRQSQQCSWESNRIHCQAHITSTTYCSQGSFLQGDGCWKATKQAATSSYVDQGGLTIQTQHMDQGLNHFPQKWHICKCCQPASLFYEMYWWPFASGHWAEGLLWCPGTWKGRMLGHALGGVLQLVPNILQTSRIFPSHKSWWRGFNYIPG